MTWSNDYETHDDPIPSFCPAGLEEGAEPREIKRAARLLQEYELLFWDTVAQAP